MKATEAYAISCKNGLSIEKVKEAIKNRSEDGYIQVLFPGMRLTDEIILALAKDGYIINTIKTPFGEWMTVVEWFRG